MIKKYFPEEIKKFFDEEERELYESMKQEGWKPIPKKELEKQKEELKEAVYYTRELRKSASISIRLTPIDLERIKAKAAEEGLPYQTLISSIIHKYAHGK